jgi:hypothetical protein
MFLRLSTTVFIEVFTLQVPSVFRSSSGVKYTIKELPIITIIMQHMACLLELLVMEVLPTGYIYQNTLQRFHIL